MAPNVSIDSYVSINRAYQFPIVNSAVGVATDFYTKAKAKSPILTTTLGMAEATVNYVYTASNPILLRVETPLKYVDNVASKGLDILESRIPVIKKTPEAILNDSKSFVSHKAAPIVGALKNVQGYGESAYKSSVAYGTASLKTVAESRLARIPLDNLEFVLNLVESLMDKHLPADADEKVRIGFDKAGKQTGYNTLAHAACLGDRLKRRVHKLALVKIGLVLELTRATISDLTTLIGHAWEASQERASSLIKSASVFPQEVVVTVQKIVVQLQRNLMDTQAIAVKYLPDSVKTHLDQALAQSQALYNQFASTQYLSTVTKTSYDYSLEKFEGLREASSQLTALVLQATGISWMVSAGSDVKPSVKNTERRKKNTRKSHQS